MMTNSLELLTFDNRFINELPADPREENISRQVANACYSRVTPCKASHPELIAYSREVAGLLGIDESDCTQPLFRDVFVGNRQLQGMTSYASCYGGHQFGHWAGQLGDGRAINLGEVVDQKKQHWTLQLKGAGPTPYSRRADGFAVLRSSVREFLCSEAMYHLGVPTTRALSLCLTGDAVSRDMFYDGNVHDEPGAVVCRVAPSFTRFGHFQILAAQGNIELLKQLLDFTIRTDFPHLGAPDESRYIEWFREVCHLTGQMILHWMRVGFVHGVMNTDNMSILGLTIDYGPYGWLESYEPEWTPNTTDAQGKRYCFGRQPVIAHWNLLQLAQAIAPLFKEVTTLEQILEQYWSDYQSQWLEMMLSKLGLSSLSQDEDELIVKQHLDLLKLTETDMTIFYRRLAEIDIHAIADNGLSSIPEELMEAYYQASSIDKQTSDSICLWLTQYAKRSVQTLSPEALKNRQRAMNRTNPKYVLRNYLAQQAIEKSTEGDHSMLHKLLDVMRNPYDEQPGNEQYAARRPEWARHKAGCSMLSCSS